MKKACVYCGKIHDKNFICDKKPKQKSKQTRQRHIENFRSSYDWKLKHEEIKRRDKYLCQACLNNLPGTLSRINQDSLSVHHIRPLITNWDLRLDRDNLITLCDMHHELAECGKISVDTLLEILPPEV